MQLQPGDIIGPYKVDKKLGKGGIAAVYRVHHRNLRSLHALKVLFTTDPDSKARLITEGRVQAAMRHPNIVTVTDIMEIEGAPSLVLEYVSGPNLMDWLQDDQPGLPAVLEVYRGILSGMEAAQGYGVVHRDLKPENILLSPTKQGVIPKICDFGLVKVLQAVSDTQTGVGFGTPEYMSPEQIVNAADVDHRADMWALGCLLYEMVTRRSAFVAENVPAIYDKIRSGDYAPPDSWVPDLPIEVSTAISRMLVVDVDERIDSASAVLEILYGEAPETSRYTPGMQAHSVELQPRSVPPPVMSVVIERSSFEWTTQAVVGIGVVIALLTALLTAVVVQLVTP